MSIHRSQKPIIQISGEALDDTKMTKTEVQGIPSKIAARINTWLGRGIILENVVRADTPTPQIYYIKKEDIPKSYHTEFWSNKTKYWFKTNLEQTAIRITHQLAKNAKTFELPPEPNP